MAGFGTIRFEVKPEHLALLKRAIVRWEDCEFGAPAIDCKRPYGNSFVYGDIGEILGIEPEDVDAEFSGEQEERMLRLHQETDTALQIALATGRFEAGWYEADKYMQDWRPADA